MWYCLRKRKNQKQQDYQANMGHQEGHCAQDSPAQDVKQIYTPTVENIAQPWRDPQHNHHVLEVPGDKSPAPLAELWQGNYRS